MIFFIYYKINVLDNFIFAFNAKNGNEPLLKQWHVGRYVYKKQIKLQEKRKEQEVFS
jgi:translation initiation factor IF-3